MVAIRNIIYSRQGGGKTLADNLDIPLLGEVPIIEAISEGGDSGIPIVMSDPQSPASQAYKDLAGQGGGATQYQSG